MGLRQYVIQTNPLEEQIAVDSVGDAGFATTWLATREEIRTPKGRFITKPKPLFPSYIFAAFDVHDGGWKVIARLRGVKRILGSDPMRPTPLPLGAVDQLQARFEAGEFKVRAPEPIRVGERLAIDVGPFAGRIAVCTMSKGERLKVLMAVLGDEREIELWSGTVRRLMVAAQ